MRFKTPFLVLFFLLFSFTLYAAPAYNDKLQYAYITAPVADLLGKSLSSEYTNDNIEKAYKNLPFSGSSKSCIRLHQALFNERVAVLDQTATEAKIQVCNFYYLVEDKKEPQTVFWTLKKNLTTIKQLKTKHLDLAHFPKPINYQHSSLDAVNKNTVTLKKPFYDPITKKTYSIGTRFIAHTSSNDNASFIKVYIFDSNRLYFRTTKIPRNNCVKITYKSNAEKVKMFVRLLRQWSNQPNGFIPYVLGGFSWTQSYDDPGYSCIKDSRFQNGGYYYVRKKYKNIQKTGLDCVGIIGRAAQICGIPYYLKNTTTIAKQLLPLTPSDKLKEGDLIWFQGHVMIVSNLKKNTLIESRGYGSGNGKTHEIPLSACVRNAKTFEDLKRLFFEDKPLELLNSDGSLCKVYNKFKILKLDSVWTNNPFAETKGKATKSI